MLEEGRMKWVGYVRHTTTDERRVTWADFLIVAQKPRGAKFILAVDSFAQIDSKPKKHARIEPVTNKLPALRILDSTKEFVGESRSDLDSLRIPLIFGPEKFKQPSVDLSEGNVPADAETAESLYQRAMDVLRPVFSDAQMTILGQAFRQIENKICLVLGCRKTDTLAYAVCALNLAGHKILPCSEENPCLDNFMDRLEKARLSLGILARGDDEKNVLLRARLSKHKYLRFIPPGYERRSLKEKIEEQGAEKEFHARKAFYPEVFLKDAKAAELARAYMVAENDLRHQESVEYAAKCDALNRTSFVRVNL